MGLRSGVAVALVQAGSCSSNLTPCLGTYICCRCGPKKKKKKVRRISGPKKVRRISGPKTMNGTGL